MGWGKMPKVDNDKWVVTIRPMLYGGKLIWHWEATNKSLGVGGVRGGLGCATREQAEAQAREAVAMLREQCAVGEYEVEL